MTVIEARTDEVSLHLEPFRVVPLSPEVAAIFDRPLFITGTFICYEVIFWSPSWRMWIYLVAEHTRRLFPPESRSREVIPAELPWYEAESKRLGLIR